MAPVSVLTNSRPAATEQDAGDYSYEVVVILGPTHTVHGIPKAECYGIRERSVFDQTDSCAVPHNCGRDRSRVRASAKENEEAYLRKTHKSRSVVSHDAS